MGKAMKILLFLSCASVLASVSWGASDPMTEEAKRSYAVGANFARNLKQQGLELDAALVAKGLLEEMEGKSLLAEAEVVSVVQQLRAEAQKKQAAEKQKASAERRKQGAALLVENAKKEGVKALPGGVQYRVLQAGTGSKPDEEEEGTVRCHYRGLLVDGTVFEASPPGKPKRLSLERLIPGLREAILEMPAGSKWEIVIPPEKAYGKRGGGPVGPNEVVIFEVELVD